MPGAGSDRLHAHRNIVRCAEKYNILDFEENRTSHCFGTVSFEKCRCYFGTEGVFFNHIAGREKTGNSRWEKRSFPFFPFPDTIFPFPFIPKLFSTFPCPSSHIQDV